MTAELKRDAEEKPCANRWPGSYGQQLTCGHPESCHRGGFCDVIIGDDIMCGCPKYVKP